MKNLTLVDVGRLGNKAISITISGEISDGTIITKKINFKDSGLEDYKLGGTLSMLKTIQEIENIEIRKEKNKA